MCMGVAYMILCVQCLQRPEQGVGSLELELQFLATMWELGIEP